MTILRAPIIEDDSFQKSRLGELWFEPSVDESVRNTALGYIGAVGSVDFTPLAEIELSRDNYATRKSALEAILQLLGRESVRRAAEYAVEASFDEIGSAALEPVLAGFRELSEESLVKALDHRSGLIRAKAIKTLSERRLLKPEQVRRFFGDASLETRKAAVAASEAAGLRLSLEELKDALVLKEVKNGLGSNNNYDYEGNAVFDNISEGAEEAVSDADLLDRVVPGKPGHSISLGCTLARIAPPSRAPDPTSGQTRLNCLLLEQPWRPALCPFKGDPNRPHPSTPRSPA